MSQMSQQIILPLIIAFIALAVFFMMFFRTGEGAAETTTKFIRGFEPGLLEIMVSDDTPTLKIECQTAFDTDGSLITPRRYFMDLNAAFSSTKGEPIDFLITTDFKSTLASYDAVAILNNPEKFGQKGWDLRTFEYRPDQATKNSVSIILDGTALQKDLDNPKIFLELRLWRNSDCVKDLFVLKDFTTVPTGIPENEGNDHTDIQDACPASFLSGVTITTEMPVQSCSASIIP
jgi:hypothetical protein